MDSKQNIGYRNLGVYNLGYYNLGYRNLGDYNLGYWNLGGRNLGDYNLGYWNLGGRNLGVYNLGNQNLGDYNLGYWNLGYRNLGDWNLGDRNLGYLNTDINNKIRVFNKECNVEDWIKANKPSWLYFNYDFISDMPKWISLSDLTPGEKKEYPNSEKLGGYLIAKVKGSWTDSEKKEMYQRCAQKSWNETTQEDRDLTFKLPNFDADVFFDIFGIDVRKKEVEKDLTVEYITVNGKKYKCVEGE
jgi:hypothetical protein